ncbi:hypothetical protein F7725_016499 [Dissostichus mawsoni]|uniref:Uncharacterized protein n=1 Tax=Dissostichus mawsoni TaxID=36200 RepID=A0A7J5Z2G3_DISMA|nr:hypothetical protein F7725_016499 [Dissostichus mawsoni]
MSICQESTVADKQPIIFSQTQRTQLPVDFYLSVGDTSEGGEAGVCYPPKPSCECVWMTCALMYHKDVKQDFTGFIIMDRGTQQMLFFTALHREMSGRIDYHCRTMVRKLSGVCSSAA